MNAFVDKLHQNGQHYGMAVYNESCSNTLVNVCVCVCVAVVIIDPGINNDNSYKPYSDGVQMGIFIKVSQNAQYKSTATLMIHNN